MIKSDRAPFADQSDPKKVTKNDKKMIELLLPTSFCGILKNQPLQLQSFAFLILLANDFVVLGIQDGTSKPHVKFKRDSCEERVAIWTSSGLFQERKISPKRKFFGCTSRRHPGVIPVDVPAQKLRSRRPNPGKPSIWARDIHNPKGRTSITLRDFQLWWSEKTLG